MLLPNSCNLPTSFRVIQSSRPLQPHSGGTSFDTFAGGRRSGLVARALRRIGVLVALVAGWIGATSVFANLPGGGTGTGGNVTLTTSSGTTTLSNGIISIPITQSNANITHIYYTFNNTGSNQTLDLVAGNPNTGKLYWETGGFGTGTFTYSVVTDPATNGGNYAEVDLLSTSATAGNMDVHFSMLRGSPGFYVTLICTHGTAASSIGEMRTNIYAGSIFNWMSVDNQRTRQMMPVSGATQDVIPGAPVEAYLWTNGFRQGQYEDKYSYSANWGDQRVWGWSSVTNSSLGFTGKNVGLWDVSASVEYLTGGPMKRELMSHMGNTILYMFEGSHYGGGTDSGFAANETWTKVYGPYFVYCNNIPSTVTDPVQASTALYADAQAQATAPHPCPPSTSGSADIFPACLTPPSSARPPIPTTTACPISSNTSSGPDPTSPTPPAL